MIRWFYNIFIDVYLWVRFITSIVEKDLILIDQITQMHDPSEELSNTNHSYNEVYSWIIIFFFLFEVLITINIRRCKHTQTV